MRKEQNIKEYVYSTDYLEKKTNIDFFPILEDQLERNLESAVIIENWDW